MKPSISKENRLAVLKIIGAFLFFGALWIYLSDHILAWIVHDTATLTHIAVFKGILFIVLTALLLYYLITRYILRLELSEERLKKTAEGYRFLAENARDVIWTYDLSSGFTYMSPSVKYLRGYTVDEALQQTLEQTLTPESYRKVMELLETEIRLKINGQRHEPEWSKTFELEHFRKDGTTVWTEVIVTALYDETGVIKGIMGVTRDITERKRAENALKESEASYRQLFDNAVTGIYRIDFKTNRFMKANAAFCNFLDCSQEELAVLSPFDILSEESKRIFLERLERLASGMPLSDAVEYEIENKHGKRIRVQLHSRHIYDTEGHAVAADVVVTDIPERERKDDALLLMQFAMERAPESILLVDELGFITYANDAACASMGYSRDELLKMKVFDIDPDFPIEGWEQHKISLKRLGKMTFEGRHRTKDGRLFPVEVTTNYVEYGGRFLSIAFDRDITDRKQAEERLQTANRRLENIIEFLPDATFIIDKDKRIVAWNRALEELTGAKAEDMVGKGDYEYAIPFYNSRHPILIDLLLKPDPEIEATYSLIRREGDILYAEAEVPLLQRYLWGKMSPIYDEAGQITGAIETIRDVTERKKAEDALRSSEERYRTIFENTATANTIVAEDSTIIMANDNFAHLCGYSKEELEGKMRWTAFVHDDDLEKMQAYHQMRRLDPRSAPSSYEFRAINRKGEILNLFMTGAIIPGTGISIISMIDLTERKRLETQLIQSQKMESVGRLAGGVAHDFNNMLSVIMGNAELAMISLDPSQPSYKHFQDILNAGKHSADLTRQLLAFARKQDINPTVLDLNDTVSGMLKMLRRLIGEDIELHWNPGYDLWKVKIDPSQVDQLLVNLAVNARDAIGKTGRIVIGTSNEICDEHYCTARPECIPGEYVMLAVSDNGCGMEKEMLTNIFEPFFTTKKEGEGTGLGLATVYGITRQNNGFINVYSEPGIGTTFRIYLPRNQAERLEAPDDRPEMRPQGGTETVMIVEDEEALLNLTKGMLESLGYHVLAVMRVDEAIELVEEYEGTIDLLLTDVVMPEMNGKELSERMKCMKPELKCLYMSGYTADVIARQGVLDKGVHFIPKPFSLKNLAEKVRETLDQ